MRAYERLGMWTFALGTPWAQTYHLHGEVEVEVPELGGFRLKSTPIEIEFQAIGKNIYLWIKSPQFDAMWVNSIETLKFLGMNLTDEYQWGAQIQQQATGLSSQLLVNRKTAELIGFHDLIYKKQAVRIPFLGPCELHRAPWCTIGLRGAQI